MGVTRPRRRNARLVWRSQVHEFARVVFPPQPPDFTTPEAMIRIKHSLPKSLAALLLSLAVAHPFSGATEAKAQGSGQQRVPIVRDAEIEALVRDYARPILKAAGLTKSGIDIILVNDERFNAFVAGRRMFINTGALLIAESPNEIIGVIAHEAGHIAGGHQERLRDQLARAQTMAVVASLLGIGATVAGAAADSRALAQAGGGIAIGGTEIARRGLLGYQRTEETTADRSALTYLERTGQSAKGMLKTFQRFASTLALSGARIDPYQISHPMPRERIANLSTLAEASPHYNKADSPDLQLRHDLARAKIAAHTQGAAAVSRLFRSDPRGLPATYGEAITAYLSGNPRNAMAKADRLVEAQPRNPYFQELRGEIYMKANRPAQAAEAFGRAMQLDPARSGVLQVSYGQALLATGKPANVEKAVTEIRKALDRDPENTVAYRFLAQAYGQLGRIGEAELATAEGHFHSGNNLEARVFAARAQTRLKRGEPAWVRAQDIINNKPPKKKK